MDTGWEYLAEAHERLRWARLRAGYATAKAASESLGMKKDTYSAYEREPGKSKVTGLDHQRAIQFGRKFKVSWEWLLLGIGSPFSGVQTTYQERVMTAMSDAPEEEQERIAKAVEALLRTGTNG
ncbi:helix-turn-helix transcriptional regulator [Brevundimonas sp.]|uniref:helix-turn-helix domain-containing protein n=1 Tax=Brevundimonas sp. TaxID=1871086 RepID=UPI002D63186F|nr:helix-turn-helix transcriptional regulator [Brevundimonas sp.]HYC66671.1 helix-turn-helix transcriptional regulator [Brevundimonas sp.]